MDQYGVSVGGGVEVVADRAMLARQMGCIEISSVGADAYDSMKRAGNVPVLAKNISSVAEYAFNLYARTPPKLHISAWTTGESNLCTRVRG